MTATTEKTNCGSELETKQEEILGSVTHETQSTERPFPIQLRTSARVSKKLKLDSQNSVQTISTEKKETKAEEKNTEQKSNTVRRVHELWSTEDKNAFFEALNEYGKDFDAIQTHMNNKRKKRGINHSISKNRDQARHFYYRTWHKISKYLEFPQEVKKAVREQYGLINFGEFRKKIGFVSEKNFVKLNELIYSGSTQVRVKGKTVRIKTPVCRALRKLNQLQETSGDVKLPTRIMVELRPRNNESWCRVQSLAMNPRVRTSLPLHQQLISLIIYLQKKWKLPDAKMKEKPSVGGEPQDTCDSSPVLRIAPKQGINIVAPSVRSGEFITSSRISLLAYEEKLGAGGEAVAENLKVLQSANKSGKSTRNLKKQHTEDEKAKSSTENENQAQASSQNASSLSETDYVSSAVSHLLSLNNELDMTSKYVTDESDWNSPGKEDFELDTEITVTENKEEIIEKAKAGWTMTNVDAIRVGDLYLMFGSDSKLQLDYWWEDRASNELFQETVAETSSSLNGKNKLTDTLLKLISIAKLYLSKEKNQCSCGHVCKSNNKFVNGRSRVVNKSKNTINNSFAEHERIPTTNIPLTENSSSKNSHNILSTSVNKPSPPSYIPTRGVSSFKEQLDLQYYNRRRCGDKQRTLPLMPKVTIQVIKPKEENISEAASEKSNETGLSKEILSSDTISRNSLNSMQVSTSDTDVLPLSNELPLFPGGSISNKDILLQDEDCKSSCSSITRFLKQALPEVLPQSVNPSPDGLSTPVIYRNAVINLNHSNESDSSTWSMFENSNFSIGNLLTHFDTSKQGTNAVSVDEESRFSTDVETQFQRLINESSVDYTEKFANLAAQIASETNNPKI